MIRLRKTAPRLMYSFAAMGLFAAPGFISVANAQESDGAENKLAIEEIVVTSRKREESVFDIPVAVTAFSAEDIVNAGLEELPDLVAHTPGFHYAENSVTRGGRFNRRLIFRGMNPRTDRQTRQAATVFIDGAPTIGSEIGTTDNYERIEIIKGPQSAYFGRQTFSGAINAVTRTPGNELGGQVSAEVGSWGRTDFGLQFEGPIVQDKFLFRVSGRKYSTDGEYKNSADPSTRLGAESTEDVGLGLFFTPNENFTAKLRVRRWKDEDGPSVGLSINAADNSSLVNCQPGGTGTFPGGDWICGEVPFIGRDQIGMDTTLTPALQAFFFSPEFMAQYAFDPVQRMGLERNAEENSLVMDWVLPNSMVISSITAKHKNEYSSLEDFDRRVTAGSGSCGPYFFDPSFTGCSGDSYNMNLTGQETFFQEFRLTSSSEQSFRWMVGVSYTEVDAVLQGPSKIGGSFMTSLPSFSTVRTFNPETSAIFGSIGWDITDRFTVSVEGRYQEDEVIEQTNTGPVYQDTFTSENPRLILDFKPRDDTTLWITYAEGTQPGQFNATVGALPQGEVDQLRALANCGASESDLDCLIKVSEEEITMVEIGVKSLFWDGRAQISAAAYIMDWEKITAPNIVTIIDTEGAGIGGPKNVQVNTLGGQADMSGLEIEGTVLLSDHFQLDATISLVNSEIGVFESPDAERLLGDLQLNGLNNEFSRYPGESGTLTLSYNTDVGADKNFFARGDILYQGETWMTNANVSKTAAWTTFNLRAGILTDGWRLEAYAINLFDKEGYSAFQHFTDLSFTAGGRTLMAGFIPRQTFGIRASFFF